MINTINKSSSAIFNGLVGTLPLAIGLAAFFLGSFYTSFRSRDWSSLLFVFFYTGNGDTVFDVIYEFN
jgi:hypothetical protein